MKGKYIIGIGFLLALIFSGVSVYDLWYAHEKRIVSWNIATKELFKVAAFKEIPESHSTYAVSVGVTSKSHKVYLPDSIRKLVGNRKLEVPQYKMRMNVSPGQMIDKPLSAKRIHRLWDSLVHIRRIPAEVLVQHSLTDYQGNSFMECSMDKSRSHKALDTLYAGYCCEAEIIGYVAYPAWWSRMSVWHGLLLLLPWICWGLLVANIDKIISFYQRKMRKEVILEKEIHLADVSIEKARIYRLPDGTIFDSFSGTLEKDGIINVISPQSVSLLKSMLRNVGNKMTTEEIDACLWNGKGSKEQLYNAISRLRKDLKTVHSMLAIENNGGIYELKIPISSKKINTDMNR